MRICVVGFRAKALHRRIPARLAKHSSTQGLQSEVHGSL